MARELGYIWEHFLLRKWVHIVCTLHYALNDHRQKNDHMSPLSPITRRGYFGNWYVGLNKAHTKYSFV